MAGLRREDALAAAAAAAAEGTTAGLRDAALLRTMSDALLRASEVAAIDTRDIASEKDGGHLTIRRSKTDQEAEGAVTYLTPATMTAYDNEPGQPALAVTEVAAFTEACAAPNRSSRQWSPRSLAVRSDRRAGRVSSRSTRTFCSATNAPGRSRTRLLPSRQLHIHSLQEAGVR